MGRARILIPALWLAALALALGLWLTHGHLESDLERFMPDPAAESGLDLPAGSGPAGRIVLLAIGGGDTGKRAAASDALVDALEDAPGVSAIHNGRARPDDAALEWLLDYRYLLSPAVTPGHFSAEALTTHLAARRADLSATVPELPRALIARDPTAESLVLMERLAAPAQGARRDAHGVWVSGDGQQALLALRARTEGLDLDAQETLLAQVHEAFARVTDPAAGLVLEMSGPAVFAVQARDTIRTEVILFSTLASLALAALLWGLFGRLRAVWLAALPLGAGVLAGAVAVTLVFGELHGITLAFGITVLGVALDYPLHLFTHGDPRQQRDPASGGLWPALALGAGSTALVYAIMAITGFTGMAQLGLFVLTGILTAALLTRTLLPDLLGGRGLPAPRLPLPEALLDPPAAGRWVLAALVLGGLTVIVATNPFPWEDDLAALNPVDTEQRQLDRRLRTELGLADVRHVLMLRADTAEAALQALEALTPDLESLRAAGTLSGFESAAGLLPSIAVQETRRGALPPAEALARRLSAIAPTHGFRNVAFDPFVADVEKTRHLQPLTPDILPDGPLAERLDPLLFRHGDRWLALVALQGVADVAALDAWAARHPGITHVDFKAVSEGVLTRFRDEALTRLGWGVVAVGLLLLAATRSPGRSLRVLTSVGAGLILATAALILLDVRLTLFHLIGLLLVTGLCLDYAVFFSRPLRDARVQRTTLASVSACALSTALVFGLLALSQLPVLRALGLTVALGVVFSFLAAALLARPALKESPGAP